jgi:heptosyltransferase-1
VTSGSTAHSPESLLVVRLGAMGDVIHTLAAVSSIRTTFPNMRIGWAIEHRWRELLCAIDTPLSGPRSPQRPVVDFVHLVDTKRWRKSLLSRETKRQASDALRAIREQGYQVAADFQGALKSAALARMAKAKMILGFQRPRESPARALYQHCVEAQGSHVIEHYQSLADAVAVRPLPLSAALLPHDANAEASIARKLAGVNDKVVIINPGAGWGAKQWPAGCYGQVASTLSRSGFYSLINFGPGEEELAQEVQAASNGAAQPICCSISELIALTRRATLFIGGDTGPLHLAAALYVPVVAIFGPTDPARNGPYGTKSIVLRNPASRTSLSHTSEPDPGLLAISADEVVNAALELLRSTIA